MMSRNIRDGLAVSYFMGGLQHQIEHHLFPSMPRPSLVQLRPVVREFCRKHDIAYTEVSLTSAYGSVVTYLNTVGLRGRDTFACPLLALYR
jgi:fatty acid desaturase